MPANQELVEGQPAPDFSLKANDGKSYSLSQYRGIIEVVLYFSAKDDTPGCTKEACSFRDEMATFKKKDVVVLGVSLDDLDSHTKFQEKYNLNFPLLSDTDHVISDTYGVYKEKNNYGKKFWGIERSTFIIDKSGKLKKIFRRVHVDGHNDEVLKNL